MKASPPRDNEDRVLLGRITGAHGLKGEVKIAAFTAAPEDIAAYGARVVTYGGTNGETTIRPFSLFWKMLDVLGTSMGSPHDFKSMLHLVERNGIRPVVDSVASMAGVVAAAQRIAESKQFGNVVLAIA